MVVVGRLALFFSQLPTADSPVASWFFVFYVGFFRFFFPVGHESYLEFLFEPQKSGKRIVALSHLAVCVLTLSEYIPGQSLPACPRVGNGGSFLPVKLSLRERSAPPFWFSKVSNT